VAGDERAHGATHAVSNQPPPLEDYSLFESDAALREGVAREGTAASAGGERFAAELRAFGALAGRAATFQLGRQANRSAPELRTHDRFGHRIDEVDYHPAWHAVMGLAMEHRVHNLPWHAEQARGASGTAFRPGAIVARAALHSMLSQVEAGACCPLTMTFAAWPVLREDPQLAADWGPPLAGDRYDPRLLPARAKSAALIGMAMTEKQGGSDVRANTTRAIPDGAGAYQLIGHKWFCSAPMSDAFLVLAQLESEQGAARGLSCFLVPRVLPDGRRNAFELQRLKDKLGNRSNASSEVEFRGTAARLVGEPGRGVRTILEMVQHTRLDCVSGSAGLMRQAVAQAIHHARHRSAFGRHLTDQPLMQNVLADLALESEAATALMLRLAAAFEAPAGSSERAFARIATAAAKYWVCKRAPQAIAEAMECLGGAGYVEESMLPRLYREAPVNAIWEGSGNVICLDVLRALVRESDAAPALLAELRSARGAERRLDAWVDALERELRDPADAELRARRTTERIALALEASLLVRFAPNAVADAFCAARLGGADGIAGLQFGALPRGVDAAAIVSRAAPGA
jgi:putative acyl-CoA dehydrogenase